MSEKTVKRLKWVIGVLIFLLVFIMSQTVFGSNSKLSLFLLIGLGLGYVESHSEVGIASGYVDFFVTGKRSRLYGLLLLFALGSLATIFIHAYSASNGAVPAYMTSSNNVIPGTKAVSPVNFGLILGAFLFGIGLTLNAGCGLGTLRNIGLGQTRYLFTFLFILLGTIPGQFLKTWLDSTALHQYEIQAYFPEMFGYGGTILVVLLLFGLLIIGSRYIERERIREGTYADVEEVILPEFDEDDNDHTLFSTLFKKEWSRLVTIVFITLFTVFALLRTGEHLAVTESYLYPGVALVEKLGVSLSRSVFEEAHNVIDQGLLSNHNVVQNIGIILGASVFGFTSGNFSFTWGTNIKELVVFMFSGLLMGMGAVLASGCIVGALYSGIVNFSLSGWVVFFFMSLGMWLTVKGMNGKISTIPKVTKK